ncbi:MAG: nitrilase, partial [Comamonadaceae bacterium]
MSPVPLRIACFQDVGTPGDISANLTALADAASQARSAGAHLLITSEMFLTGYDCGAIDDLARRSPSLVAEIADIARSYDLALLVGMPVPLDDGGTGNCAVLVNEHGEVLARRTKSHLYGSIDRSRFTEGHEPVTLVD